VPDKNHIVIQTHVTSGLTKDEAYVLAMQLRSQGFGSEIVTFEEWKAQDRGTLQDLTPFGRERFLALPKDDND
jgi:hypothetical protein